MSTQPVTLHLPDKIYQRVRQTARTLQRPLQDFLVDALATALPLLDDLPPEMADDMSTLALLNDTALWRAAQSSLSPSSQERLDLLLDKKGQGVLTVKGQQELDQLLKEYERVVLIRAQAALLLRQRGYDVSDPATLTSPIEIP